MALTAAQLFTRVGLTGADQVVGGLQKVSRQVDSTGRTMGGLGNAGGRLAGGLARVGAIATTAVASGLVASAKAAIDYESAFAGVRKTVDASEAQLKELSGDFREMSTEIPISATALAGLGETAGALGIGAGSSNPIGQIKEFVRVTALLGETTDVSADQAATSLGQLGNVLDLREQDYERFASTLVDLGNKGASTESQILAIATRAGAAGKQIGLASAETLGWASSVANLGIEEEAGGSSLQTFFLRSLQMVSAGGKKLETYAKTAGMTGKEFKRAFEEDASGALETFVTGLGRLGDAEQLAVLKALGFNDIRITRTLLGLAGSGKNLTNSLDVAGTAWEANTALATEAQKRFDTVASSIQVLKNNLVDMAITVGTGALPGIKRFTQETVAFLKANRGEVEELGAEIGSTLEGVDFQEILGGARTFVGVLKDAAGIAVGILTTLNQLPTEVKAAGLALIGLNKVSGGAVTDIVGGVVGGAGGGLVRNLISHIPGVGGLTAMPVRVVNWPMGGLGGAGGAAGTAGGLLGGIGGGGSILSRLLRVGAGLGVGILGSNILSGGVEGNSPIQGGIGGLGMIAGGAAIAGPLGAIAGSVAGVVQTQQEISNRSTAQGQQLNSTMQEWLAQSPTVGELQNGLAGVERGITDIRSNPLNVLIQGDALTQLEAMRDALKQRLAVEAASAEPTPDTWDRRAPAKTPAAMQGPIDTTRLKGILERQDKGGRGGGQDAAIATYWRNIERETREGRVAAQNAANLATVATHAASERPPTQVTVPITISIPPAAAHVQVINRTIRYGPMIPNQKRRLLETL